MGKSHCPSSRKIPRAEVRRLFWIIPVVDSTPVWIDHRVMVSPLQCREDRHQRYCPGRCVDAVVIADGVGCRKGCFRSRKLSISDYLGSANRCAEVIGQMNLADILVGRAKMDADLQMIIDERTTPWGLPCNRLKLGIL